MGEDFIVGVTDLVSGEKDPRNLMIIFSILRAVMIEWAINNHVETLFDSVFCYFPITFRPPPDDPYGITSQDLKTRLRDCIAASPLFAGQAFPALLDKLDSTSLNVKRDVLQAITACARSYGPATMSIHCTQLWDSLKFEILNAQEEDLAGEALVVISAIAQCLQPDLISSSSQSALERYLRPIIAECNDLLKEPQQKQAKPAGQILGSIASASPIAFSIANKEVMPSLITTYQDFGGISKQRALLEILKRILDAALHNFGTWGSLEPEPTTSNSLKPFKDRLFEIFSQALMGAPKEEVAFRVVALEGLLRLAKIRNFLEEDEIGMLVQYYDEVLLLEDSRGTEELKAAAIEALIEISRMRSNLIMDITFPAFMAKLPDSDPDDERFYLVSLEGLAKLSVEKHIIDLLVRRLLNKLVIVMQASSSSAYPHAIISTLLYVLNNSDLENDPKLDTYYDKLVLGLIGKVVVPMKETAQSLPCVDDSFLDVLGRLANVLVRIIGEDKQEDVLRKVFNNLSFEDGKLVGATDNLVKRRAALIVPTYILAGIRRETRINPDIEALLEELVTLATHESEPSFRLAISRQVALITNKWLAPNNSQLEVICNHLLGNLTSVAVEGGLEPSNERAQNSLRVLLWLTKALLLRADKFSITLLDHLLALLAHPTYGVVTARGFAILLAPDDLLSKPNFAIIRLLYKQRFFSYCIPKLSSEFRNADASTKPNYLIALAGILKWVPSEIVMQQLDMLLPLLLQSVDLPEANVKAATIDTLMVTVRENPKAVEGHVSSLIARLLDNSSGKDGSAPPRVRLAALQCLQIFPTAFRHEVLLPYKKQVNRKLIEVLDDPKRHVRKEGVDCRAAWFRMDEPDED
ncbi:MAG: hypothetical protein M1837_003947 [Sclerophora amabilis]|nr:MAG: hypothetical protein M1837_003947 [Sclerophora amabilis]